MIDEATTIKGPYGHFTRRENGLVYFYKTDDAVIDEAAAIENLETIRKLDNSGAARLIVIQGAQAIFTFEAQRTLLTTTLLGGLAIVSGSKAQLLMAGLLNALAKALKSKFPIRMFANFEEAEAWLLALPTNCTKDVRDQGEDHLCGS